MSSSRVPLSGQHCTLHLHVCILSVCRVLSLIPFDGSLWDKPTDRVKGSAKTCSLVYFIKRQITASCCQSPPHLHVQRALIGKSFTFCARADTSLQSRWQVFYHIAISEVKHQNRSKFSINNSNQSYAAISLPQNCLPISRIFELRESHLLDQISINASRTISSLVGSSHSVSLLVAECGDSFISRWPRTPFTSAHTLL